MWVRPLAEADATCGAKAAALARLIAAGLPVPDGFVIDDRAFRFVAGEIAAEHDALGHALEAAAARIAVEEAPPSSLVDDVLARATALGTVAVRSSASIEDSATGSAAGVFASVTGVAPRDVWPAIRSVWTSALTPLAVAYARGRPIAISVIVQRYVPGDRITIYTRPPGAPVGNTITVQRGEHVRDYARDDVDPLVALALRAEHAIGAGGGADVELVETRDGTAWIVQARPIVHPPAPALVPPPPALLAALVADGRRWTWDIAHNPDPLSPAQAGLVERVEAVAPWSMRICAGYLYTTGPIPTVAIDDFDARAAAIEARFAQLLGGSEPSLPDALDRYVAFYAVWARELAPLVASARGSLAPGNVSAASLAPANVARARPSSVEATLLAAARGELDEQAAIARIAPLSTTWDVAVPTFGERPEAIRDAIARASRVRLSDSEKGVRPHFDSSALEREDGGLHSDSETGGRPHFDSPALEREDGGPEREDGGLYADSEKGVRPHFDSSALAQERGHAADGNGDSERGGYFPARASGLAQAVADLAERDDLWFAKAQAMVRFALLRRAREIGVDPDDICWISLDDALAGIPPDDAHRRAAAARAANARAAKWAMPLEINGESVDDRPSLHGFGSGARVSGRVVRFASLASAVAVGRGDVIVTRAITPALAVFVIGCAAIVSETGGPLDHGAAIARELGIPFVVGCRDAWSLLHDGMIVTIDHDTVARA